VLALRTLAACVLGRHGYEKTAVPLRLVLQPAAQFERAGVENGTVESRLLANLLSRLGLPALGGRRHILYLKVFDKHDGVVFADVVRRLVYEVLSDIGNLGVQLGDFGFRLLPVA
jgi:hypothetical protein